MEHSRIVIWTALALLGLTVAGGAAAYHYVEGWSWLDSFYMVVITLSTVGFREVHDLSGTGQLITIGVISFGLLAITFLVAGVTRIILEGEIRRVLGKRRMERDIAKLSDHYIVCGYGRVGRVVCKDLEQANVPFIVVDNDDAVAQRIQTDGHLLSQGDATEDATLEAAGIQRASGLILALPSEADNVYVTLLAKDLCPGLNVIARGLTDNGERRLRAAGADRVVSPNIIGAHRIAYSVLRPTVVEFIDVITSRRGIEELQIDEVKIPADSPLAGKTLEACEIRRKHGLMVVGILQSDGSLSFNPSPQDRIDAGLTLVVLGHRDQLDRFQAAV